MSSASASSSTASLASTTTVSSRTPLNRDVKPKPKDFAAAFAQLQSTYGFGGAAPTPVQKTPVQKKKTTPAASAPPAPALGQQKDYAAAFASLQSSYGFAGFAGGAPVPVQKSPQNSQKRDSSAPV
ncbi:hypothetical protein B0H15DRAFT_272948 [Mycena belliarum]|uniref:Uncharacterized protein n=1 Tax=Mycena belliarum TaxID=1033014 RepID=A0AAD6U9J7_9AGAR|nr:hypothetical protein B0H15DRAFT_272948 [Mycena belliae]